MHPAQHELSTQKVEEIQKNSARLLMSILSKTYYVPVDMAYKDKYKEFVVNSSKHNKSDCENNQESDINWTQKKKSDKITSMDSTKK